MKQELIKLADCLDKRGFHKEADILDSILTKANDGPYPQGPSEDQITSKTAFNSKLKNLRDWLNALEKSLKSEGELSENELQEHLSNAFKETMSAWRHAMKISADY